MLKANDKRGLSLGAIFALVASLFIAAPAAQANENSVVAFIATGTSSQTSMVHGESFDIKARFGTGVADRLANPVNSTVAGFGFKITKPAGTTVSYTTTTTTSARFLSFSPYNTQDSFGIESSKSGDTIALNVVGGTSISTAVTITVTTFMDLDNDGVQDGGEADGNSIVITFVPWSTLGAAMTFASPPPGERGVTASVTVTAGSINWDQLDGFFTVGISGSNEVETNAATFSAISDGGAGQFQMTGAELEDHAYSFSAAVVTEITTNIAGVGVVDSYSATLYYGAATLTDEEASGTLPPAGRALLATTKVGVQSKTFTAVTLSAVTSSTVKKIGDNEVEARTNNSFTLNAFGYSGSATTVSVAAAKTLTVSSLTSVDMDADSGVIIQGVTYTSSATLLGATITIPAASSTVAISTFGQDGGGSDAIAFELSGQNLSETLTVNLDTPAYTAVYTPTNVAAPAGTSLTFAVAVKDQWGAASIRTDQRIAASAVLGGSTSTTVSTVVVAGAASVAVSPVPAARTGSAVVTFTIQTYNQDTGLWDNGGTRDTVTWNVYASANSDGFVSRTASKSASISYGVVHSWSGTIAVTVNNSGSSVVVSAPGLMVRNADVTTATASDALTIVPTAKVANFQFAATKTGTYTVTFTNGSETTTSQIVVDPAPSDKGASVVWDTTQITPGKTKVITGTLLDANGNPVDTTRAGEAAGDSGTASMLVTYTGDAGIVVGTLPTETDADGQFRLSVLTSAADRGTLTLTAVYSPDGAATAAADKVTSVQAVNVGATAASADQKITVGSFKGFVAIYTKGYMGQKLSAKVAGKWLVVDPIAAYKSNDYSRTVRLTGAGYTITVDLYIDGAFVRSEVVTTK